VLALIIVDLKLSGTEVGILNAIPVSLFALVAVPGSLLIARVGAVPALIIGLLIAAAGSALRGFASDPWMLYITTIIMAAGIGDAAIAAPTVRQWVPNRIGFATAVYTNGLLCGEIFPWRSRESSCRYWLEAGAPVWCSGPFRSWSSLSSFSCFSPAARARRCRVITCGCRIGAIRCSGKSASS
jgi:MFS family permease